MDLSEAKKIVLEEKAKRRNKKRLTKEELIERPLSILKETSQISEQPQIEVPPHLVFQQDNRNVLTIGDLTLISIEPILDLIEHIKCLLKDKNFRDYLELKKKENLTGVSCFG